MSVPAEMLHDLSKSDFLCFGFDWIQICLVLRLPVAGVFLCNLFALKREISIQNVVLYFLAVI